MSVHILKDDAKMHQSDKIYQEINWCYGKIMMKIYEKDATIVEGEIDEICIDEVNK